MGWLLCCAANCVNSGDEGHLDGHAPSPTRDAKATTAENSHADAAAATTPKTSQKITLKKSIEFVTKQITLAPIID